MTRKLPLITRETAPFWQGGATGTLQIGACTDCDRLFHPPSIVCPNCMSARVVTRCVSGLAHIVSFTVNHQSWTPDLQVPFVIAIVELVEQAGLRFLSNIVDTPTEDVRIGMPVRVVFQQVEDVWLPLFKRDEEGAPA